MLLSGLRFRLVGVNLNPASTPAVLWELIFLCRLSAYSIFAQKIYQTNCHEIYHRKERFSKDHNSLSTTIIKERMELFNKSLKNKIQLLLGDYKNDQGEIQGTKVELKVPFSYI